MALDDPSFSIRLGEPGARLLGSVDLSMIQSLCGQLFTVPKGDHPIIVELTTLGGDAEMGRRALLEIELARERFAPRRLVFLGKTVVYSAGVSLMSGFPREDRFLTKDAILLIHSRQLVQSLELSGPLRGSVPKVKSMLHQLKCGHDVEEQAFEKLIAGSQVDMDTLLEKALYNWYITAAEAVELGLVADIV